MDDRLATDSAAAAERFDRMAGMAALAGAVLSLIYAVAFVVLKNALLASPAALAGVIVGPMWYGSVGWLLLKRRA